MLTKFIGRKRGMSDSPSATSDCFSPLLKRKFFNRSENINNIQYKNSTNTYFCQQKLAFPLLFYCIINKSQQN